MTIEEEVLSRVVALLERLGIPYMVTGSIAASYYGRPRATHDADVVIDPSDAQTEALVEGLEQAGFHVNADGARQAVRERRKFNVIETARATKVDLIVKKARAFSAEEFSRRRRLDLPFARGVSVVTAEDAILSKLEWRDAAAIPSGRFAMRPGSRRSARRSTARTFNAGPATSAFSTCGSGSRSRNRYDIRARSGDVGR